MHKRVGIFFGGIVAITLFLGGVYLVTRDNGEKNVDGEPQETSLDQTTKEVINAYEALENGDTESAVQQAIATAESAPDDFETLLASADIVAVQDAQRAQTIYAQALEIYVNENNSNADGRPAQVYWATASLAEDSGNIQSAINYYERAIAAADLANEVEARIATLSQTQLERLR